jgi:hypothetical protein
MMPNPLRPLSPTSGEPFRVRTILAPERARREADIMRSILLWLIGIPIPIILLLALCTHHF